ncbi:hypothetical protein KAR91_48950 [Candidatus Pacearchaeota archaeon]|nr:hypothetical protein [Candidatus Pacearchaeota archaeon]
MNNKKPNSELIKEAKALSKNELARKLVDAVQQLSNWTEMALAMASYYYNIEPHAEIFTGPTFVKNTKEKIKERALLTLKDVPYTQVYYIVGEVNDLRTKVDVNIVSITDAGYWADMIQKLNDERERQLKLNIDSEPINCSVCKFHGSCSDSTTKTGLNIYDCQQFDPLEPKCLEPHPDEKEPSNEN